MILAPQVGEEFGATLIPAGWESTPWIYTTDGYSAFNGSTATVNGALLATSAYFAPGRTLEFEATFGAETFQHVGFGVDVDATSYWAMFSTKDTSDTLWARTNNNGTAIDTSLGSTYIGSPHRYRIEWGAAAITFYIDGALVHSESVAIEQSMRPLISDVHNDATALVVDWLHMSPYASPCTFTSRVIDAGSTVNWLALSSTGERPAGTSVTFETRTGDSATPDVGWTDWAAVGTGGAVAGPDARYIQYRATLATTNDGNTPEVASVTITRGAPSNQPPVANNVNVTTAEDTQVAVALDAIDPNSDPLTYAYTAPAHGTLSGTAPGLTYTPAADYNGPDSFTYTANDGTVDSSVATVTINVTPVNDAPVASDDGYGTDEDTLLTVDAPGVLGNDSDVDSSTLTAIKVSDPAHGTLTLNADGSFTYTPAADYNGPDSFTYKANDGAVDSNVATVTITVAPVNDAPVLAAIGNQTVAEGVQLEFTASAMDVDLPANSLTYSLVGAPEGASINPITGAFTWTPTEAQGPDTYTFSVKVSDGQTPALTDEKPVTVNVSEVNVAPVLGAIGNKTVDEGVQLEFTASATDVDLPANILTFSLVGAPSGASIDPATGAFTWTPTEAQGPGEYTFIVRVTDNGAPVLTAEEEIAVSVSEVNTAPVASDVSVTTAEDTTAPVTLAATDVDGNALSYTIVVAPQHGTLSGAAPNLTYTPDANYNGPDSFTFKVNDGTVDSNVATVSITITPVNDPPTLAVIPNQSNAEGDVVNLVLSVGDVDVPANTLTFSSTGLPSSLSIDPATGTIAGAIDFAAATDSPYAVIVTVDDGTGGANSSTVRSFTWTVTNNNRAPVLGAIGPQSGNEGTLIAFTASATDPDGNTLTYGLVTEPGGASIDPTTGAFTWTPAGGPGAGRVHLHP